GAVSIPVDVLEQHIAELPKDKQIYLYCRSGMRSLTASTILVDAGFSRVENVLGGINAWKDAGFPVVK
ncbi:MAG: rhodanese-like domain-containing protein, partial [Zetaproteobacteria bacterium]|nr:rhodanese-like domain-containing protein [Zetaproteobacteria bacterium]